MFLNQPLAARFGTELLCELGDPGWTSFEFAVAWVRRSGTKHLRAPVEHFLQRGGQVLATLGVDLGNTSIEGLSDLFAWESSGRMETYIYHDERGTTFHPKFYLFSSRSRGRLFVGSNNLTEPGLYTNHEGALRFDGPLVDENITQARAALAAWRDEQSDLVHRLDSALLHELEANGYVRVEAELRRLEAASGNRTIGTGLRGRRLFGKGQHIPVPATPASRARKRTAAAVRPSGQILLLRVRASRGGVQVQIPKPLRTSQFMQSANSVRSTHDGQVRAIRAASARGNVNTYKFDAPEVRGMTEPLLRMHWEGIELLYEAFDATTSGGSLIKAQLEAGFHTVPPQTLSSKRDREIATWWRFI